MAGFEEGSGGACSLQPSCALGRQPLWSGVVRAELWSAQVVGVRGVDRRRGQQSSGCETLV